MKIFKRDSKEGESIVLDDETDENLGKEIDSLVCDSNSFRNHKTGYIKIPAGSTCKIEFPLRPATAIFSGELRDRYNNNHRTESNFAKITGQGSAVFKQVVAK